jgi:4'-phosphopantetheinyl transferase
MQIKITYTQITEAFTTGQWQKLLALLPMPMQQQNQRFVQWKDRLRHLFGKLLLRDALMKAGYGPNCLEQLYYNEFNRPYIDEGVDFNLSHSGDFVICVFTKTGKVGVDVEQVAPVDFSDFDNVMTPEQWQMIHAAADPQQMFFTCWAIKESMIKAESSGMSLPLLQIHIGGNHVYYKDKVWYVSELPLHPGYCTWLCADRPIGAFELQELFFD